MNDLQEHRDLLDEIDCRIDAKLDRIQKNLHGELKTLASAYNPTNPHATAARVAIIAMTLAIKAELDR